MDKIESYLLNKKAVTYDTEELTVIDLLGKIVYRVNGLIDNLDYAVKQSIEKLDLNVNDLIELKNENKNTVSILNFGGKENDINFDNSIAIQNAIDTISEMGGGTVLIPKGIWYIKQTIKLRPYVTLEGVALNKRDTDNTGSVIKSLNATTVIEADGNNLPEFLYCSGIKNLGIHGNNKAVGLSLVKCAYTQLENVIINYCTTCLKITGGMLDIYKNVQLTWFTEKGLHYYNKYQTTTQKFYDLYVGQCRTSDTAVPIKIESMSTTDITFTNLVMENCQASCEIGCNTKVSIVGGYTEYYPRNSNNAIFKIGYVDLGDSTDYKYNSGNFKIANTFHFGVSSGYETSKIFDINYCDSFIADSVTYRKFGDVVSVTNKTNCKPLFINCNAEPSLVTRDLDSLDRTKFVVTNCRVSNQVNVTMETPLISTTATLSNNWSNFGNGYDEFEVCKTNDNFVHIKGVVTGGSDLTICVLPTNMRPNKVIVVPIFYIVNSVWTPTVALVYPDGRIVSKGGLTNTSLNFSFKI